MSPCEWLKTADGTVMHINRGGGRAPLRRCKFCDEDYRGGKLCDFPVEHGKTCDAEMCNECARTLGRGEVQLGGGLTRLNDSIDVCPIHRGKATVQDGKIEVKEGNDV